MFELEAGIRYIGDRPEIEIMHGDPLISSSIIIEGEEIGGPSVVITIGIFTTLKANEWHTQDITLQSSRTQIKQFYEKDGKITINAGFSADGYTYEQKDNAFLSLKAEDIPR
ncbi:hypothetical protein GCM10010969_22320 [Saccharibacillus kuerlensis]|uniref:Uncharacterized protein n=2 Tax=Saccharibacillus kuerlensis TaxID=459527 RepID=A0ABQ2L3H4_9BACL|nr:hypothetical protein GCM10010969_22320 [Saccharibacillus kuerlensis]